MTREEWRQLAPVLTQAVVLPEADRNALLETAGVNEALRREIQHILNRCVAPQTKGSISDTLVRASSSPHSALATPALGPGDTLDGRRYVIVRQIGRGGMGSVYLANDTQLGTLVALKVVASDERLLTEARRAAVCSSHPNVVTIHNVLRTEFNGQPLSVLVMEYVPGTPAKLLLLEGPVDPVRALRWARDVADAIAFAHEQQVLHCDLKPGNIIITHDERAKVLDFGISRPTFEADSGPLIGTLPYMAPEQLDAGQFTEAGDIYSLGVTLFELVAGRRPFEGDHTALRVQIAMTPPPRLSELVPGVPSALDAAVERALAKKPADRFRSARSFQRALEEVRTAEVQRQAAPIVISAVPLEPRRSIVRSLIVGVGLVAAAVLGVGALGALTSAGYNTTLERSDFVEETIGDWLTWGRRTSVPPFIILMMILAGLALANVVRWVATSASGSLRRLDRRTRESLVLLRRRFGFEDVTDLASCALLVSGTALAAAIWYFAPLILAAQDFISQASVERLALLAASNVTEHNVYRVTFTFVTLLMVAVWYPVLQQVRRGARAPWALMTGGAALLLTALVLLHHPYRLMNFRTTYEVVGWNSTECYLIGRRPLDLLLFCPDLPARRNQVNMSDPTLVRTGRTETNLFNWAVKRANAPSSAGG